MPSPIFNLNSKMGKSDIFSQTSTYKFLLEHFHKQTFSLFLKFMISFKARSMNFHYFQFTVAKPANPCCELNILPNQSFRKVAKYVSWFRKRKFQSLQKKREELIISAFYNEEIYFHIFQASNSTKKKEEITNTIFYLMISISVFQKSYENILCFTWTFCVSNI